MRRYGRIARREIAPEENFKVDRNAQGMGHIVLAHVGQDLVYVFNEFGEVDVAVGVYEHNLLVRCAQRPSP